MASQRQRIEYGDFQTPEALARQVSELLADQIAPRAVLEPTCGTGSILSAALTVFTHAKGFGVDINTEYIQQCNERLLAAGLDGRGYAIAADFFSTDWRHITQALADPLLIIGNPPWVTNSGLGALQSGNLPVKSNYQMHTGFEAKTGKSNFDISEAMLIRLIESVAHRKGTVLAMLCKTTVARRLMQHAHKADLPIGDLEIRRFDAKAHFGVAVDACLLCLTIVEQCAAHVCAVFEQLNAPAPQRISGIRRSSLVSDLDTYDRLSELHGRTPYSWRSGVKHDCSRVMELSCSEDGYRNGLGSVVDVEETFLFPLLKSSELQSRVHRLPTRRVIVTQTTLGEDTSRIADLAPRTWKYLLSYGDLLDSRRSSIYHNRPRFSMFGIGPYTFAPWKVAISGLYKKLRFVVVGPTDGRPTVLDDTAYFLACDSEDEATLLCELLNSDNARDFLSSLVFWDSKRPITISVLSRLDLLKVADQQSRLNDLQEVSAIARAGKSARQPLLAFDCEA